ncbi:hypothetical protein MUU74_08450 [Chryseobacterium daecheongense]|uniref:LIC_10190 family membrane protein n=1 Tax=Chryseobacterium daecheongense TaxID=192389 RepID=UPI001FD6CF6C|nr:hypothetical protein [Chryseobacterium daecheongense]UOU99972.1 hypothetical protein MUU74_08450 [Chryseobacterium daecheongense]
MAFILFSLLLLFPSCMGLGKITESLLGSLFHGISGKIISGILAITTIWTIVAFFIPLNIYVEITTLLLGIFCFFRYRLYNEWYHFFRKESLLISIISLIILFCSSFYPYILDHFGYYVPTIKWLTEYGIVKGISNLDLTLGQVSFWHIFQAGFSNFSDPFLRINAIILIVYTLYIVEKKRWIHLCFIPILLLFTQSPSPDLPAIIFSLIILNEIISENKNSRLIFLFSAFVFAIKPTMIWLPVLSVLYSAFILKANIKGLGFGALVILLFCIKNIWTFGFPVFPVSIMDLGVNWKPNPEVLKISSQYALLKTYDMQYSYQEIQQFSWLDYIKNWLFLNGIKSKINILFIVSLLLFTVFAFIKRKAIISLICISIFIKSILVLFFSAQYRFFIDVLFVLFFILFLDYFNKKRALLFFSCTSLLFIGFLSFPEIIQQHIPSFRLSNFMGKFDKKQLYQPSSYQYQPFDSYQVGNLKFNVSTNYPFNFDTPLPAISSSYVFDDAKAGIFPQLIDAKDLRKGFIWKKMNSQEKREAENVIQTIKNSYKQNK